MSGVLFIVFGIDQALEGDRAMIRTKTVKQRTVAAAFAFSSCVGGAMMTKSELPPAISLLFFGQQLGGSVFLSIAQNIMSQELINNVKSQLPDVDASMIVNSGATDLRDAVSSDKMDTLLHVYNDTVVKVFYLAIALACVGVVVALFVEWKDMRTTEEVDERPESEKEGI
ncbi:uncharacterized protein LDX57_007058 [Aspergillus melleus]|uniref:uncharacterized protein n=1 Tax=Aspergillus melleus TaxID=138277 RepID=UPI001E8E27E1|nr:uncharacterized protein LDX57_007058 [Aspergillus melleus]KAH8429394.1 hypothetical protein LDX57_007058 [Aspergillus melleus]